MPATVAGLALGPECTATGTDLLATLGIRTIRGATLRAVSTLAVSCFAAHEASIIVLDFAGALVEILECSSVPLATSGCAIGLECITARADLLAGLRIPATRRATLPAVSTLAVSTLAVSCFAAHQASIIVLDFPGALVEILERSAIPLATSGLAIGLKCATVRADLLAGLRISATRHTLLAVSTLPVVPAHIAAEATVIIHDLAGATLKVWKLGGLPIPIARLTSSVQRRSIQSYVSTGLPVRTRRNFLRGAGRPRVPEGYGQCDHCKRT
jgi:hypothetical protein